MTKANNGLYLSSASFTLSDLKIGYSPDAEGMTYNALPNYAIVAANGAEVKVLSGTYHGKDGVLTRDTDDTLFIIYEGEFRRWYGVNTSPGMFGSVLYSDVPEENIFLAPCSSMYRYNDGELVSTGGADVAGTRYSVTVRPENNRSWVRQTGQLHIDLTYAINDARNGDTIFLQDDVTLVNAPSAYMFDKFTIDNKSITIDLQGHEISLGSVENTPLFSLTNNAHLTLKNGKITWNSTNTANTGTVLRIDATSSLTLQSMDVKTNVFHVVSSAGGAVTIESGVYESRSITLSHPNSDITVNGGVFKTTDGSYISDMRTRVIVKGNELVTPRDWQTASPLKEMTVLPRAVVYVPELDLYFSSLERASSSIYRGLQVLRLPVTLELMEDVELSPEVTLRLTGATSVDLNGHRISKGISQDSDIDTLPIFTVTDGQGVVIKNGELCINNINEDPAPSVVTASDSTLTVQDLDISYETSAADFSAKPSIFYLNSSTLKVDGGTLYSPWAIFRWAGEEDNSLVYLIETVCETAYRRTEAGPIFEGQAENPKIYVDIDIRDISGNRIQISPTSERTTWQSSLSGQRLTVTDYGGDQYFRTSSNWRNRASYYPSFEEAARAAGSRGRVYLARNIYDGLHIDASGVNYYVNFDLNGKRISTRSTEEALCLTGGKVRISNGTVSGMNVPSGGPAMVAEPGSLLEIQSGTYIGGDHALDMTDDSYTIYIKGEADFWAAEGKSALKNDARAIHADYSMLLDSDSPNHAYSFRISYELLGTDGVRKGVYGSIIDAQLYAEDGDTIRMLRDITTNQAQVLLSNKTLTLDLDGHTLTFTENPAAEQPEEFTDLDLENSYGLLIGYPNRHGTYGDAVITVRNGTINTLRSGTAYSDAVYSMSVYGANVRLMDIQVNTAHNALLAVQNNTAGPNGELNPTIVNIYNCNFTTESSPIVLAQDVAVRVHSGTFERTNMNLLRVWVFQRVDGAATDTILVPATSTADPQSYHDETVKVVVTQQSAASIDDPSGVQFFDSFAAALEAAEAGDTIRLLRPHAFAEGYAIDKAITLDLGGLSHDVDEGQYDDKHLFTASADFTVKNGSLYAIAPSTVENDGSAIYLERKEDGSLPTVTVIDAAITCDNGFAVQSAGTLEDKAVMRIANSTLYGTGLSTTTDSGHLEVYAYAYANVKYDKINSEEDY
ncbi:MAG: hypothetical protein Q4C22_00905, partial [Bacillota bacterium]|nr:hypothetical protein [Bacillota bacterium]